MWEIVTFEWIFEYFFPNISAKKSPPLNLHLFFEKQMLNPNIDLHLFVHLFFEKQTLVFHYAATSTQAGIQGGTQVKSRKNRLYRVFTVRLSM